MRSVKKLLKKAMVFTLTAAMLVGTPLTASAAPLNSVYSIGDHWGGQWDEGDDSSHTGTVTNTATTTQSGVLKDNETKIIGIALDKKHLDMEKGEQDTLTATILTDTTEGELKLKYGEEGTEKALKVLASMIRWEVQNADGKVDGTTNKTLSIRVTNAGDASQVTLNPRMGTKAGKDMIVRAYIEGSWYIDENGDIQELSTNKTDGISAKATVSIKEYTKSLSWKDGENETETYVKHTLDLGELLVRNPETANDTITWTSTDTKVATVNAQGVVSVKKTGNCKIIAMGELKEAKAIRTLTIKAGTPISLVEIYKKNDSTQTKITKPIEWDLKDAANAGYQKSEALAVKTYATIKGVVVKDSNPKEAATSIDDAKKKANNNLVTGNLQLPDGAEYYLLKEGSKTELSEMQTVTITDTITWSSAKPAIADVNPTSGLETMVASKGTIGNAVITAKASSGKKATVTFKVKGSLDKLSISGINDGDTLYSGQTKELVAVKKPEGSKDGVKWSIAKIDGKAHPNVTINNKGKLTVKPQLKTDKEAYSKATIILESAKKTDGVPNVTAQSVTINLKQTSIKSISITDETIDKTVAAVTYADDKTNKKSGEVKNQSVTIQVPLGHSFKATVGAGAGIASGVDNDALLSTLDWTSSDKKAVDIVDAGAGRKKIVAKAAGKTNITVTALRGTLKADGSVKGFSKIKVSFKVVVTQPVETMTMNKPEVTLAYQPKSKSDVTPKSQDVALKVTLGPKGVKTNAEKLTWSVEKTKGTADGTEVPKIGKGTNAKSTDKLNATFKLVAPKVGDEYVVTAKSSTGVVATSTIKIVQKTVGVEMSSQSALGSDNKPVIFKEGNANNKKAIEIGDSFRIYSFVNVGESAAKPSWKAAGSENTIEGVTYSANKKGIVSIDKDGNVVGLGKGTVKITAKTPMGKSKTITVVVNIPTN